MSREVDTVYNARLYKVSCPRYSNSALFAYELDMKK